jgi:hypothetical protein
MLAVRGVKHDGVWVEDPDEIKDIFLVSQEPVRGSGGGRTGFLSRHVSIY